MQRLGDYKVKSRSAKRYVNGEDMYVVLSPPPRISPEGPFLQGFFLHYPCDLIEAQFELTEAYTYSVSDIKDIKDNYGTLTKSLKKAPEFKKVRELRSKWNSKNRGKLLNYCKQFPDQNIFNYIKLNVEKNRIANYKGKYNYNNIHIDNVRFGNFSHIQGKTFLAYKFDLVGLKNDSMPGIFIYYHDLPILCYSSEIPTDRESRGELYFTLRSKLKDYALKQINTVLSSDFQKTFSLTASAVPEKKRPLFSEERGSKRLLVHDIDIDDPSRREDPIMPIKYPVELEEALLLE
jgi:hypothetical protein